MKTSKLILYTFLFLFIQSCAIKKNVTHTKIFTYIKLNKEYGQIRLGDNFEKHINKISIIRPSVIFLKEEVFGGSETIQLIFDDNNKIKEMIFVYNKTQLLQNKVQSYITDLGNPIIKNGKAIWNDGITQFEISKIKFHNEMRLKSSLRRLD
ncbi:hypothetical protein [uncultured Winogradskyella sp.]|uniref:hypothetical protein n=1 Tax=uncultured Winogradskyella sp. TaxID=395353 RepID=UPI0030D8F6FA|tara:strand:+ start:259 stop:714 length:456 start_codon:yes stop_codon:yes gene_type:complete